LDIKRVWDSFTQNRDKHPSIQNAVPIVNGQLQPNLSDPQHLACLACIQEVNNEKILHELGVTTSGVNKNRMPVDNPSQHTTGKAVDISIQSSNPLLSQDIQHGMLDQLAMRAGVGLWRPSFGNPHERTHWVIGPASYKAEFSGDSPINILVEDPAGRRIGFDPATEEIVNDFGDEAWYSGPGTEPQKVLLPNGSVIPGGYKVTGVGTGNGPFTISSFLYVDDPEHKFDGRVLHTGVATTGQPLANIDAH
jgi:hypothetical protein